VISCQKLKQALIARSMKTSFSRLQLPQLSSRLDPLLSRLDLLLSSISLPLFHSWSERVSLACMKDMDKCDVIESEEVPEFNSCEEVIA
jgi:hypothetical protein